MGDYDQSTIMFDLNYLFHHLLGPTSISITNTVTGKKQIVFFAYLLRLLFAELYKILQVIKKLACKKIF